MQSNDDDEQASRRLHIGGIENGVAVLRLEKLRAAEVMEGRTGFGSRRGASRPILQRKRPSSRWKWETKI